MLVGAISLLSVGALLAQQPTPPSQAKSTKPQVQQQAAQPAPAPAAAKAQAAPKGKMQRAAAPKWTKDQIKDAQEGLKRAKIYNGNADGMLNAATRRAIRAYQQQHKMKVTGQLSDSLLAELKAIP
jgi:peptidoglycan hydrolase-like protein with peptidoglycan-binding domain